MPNIPDDGSPYDGGQNAPDVSGSSRVYRPPVIRAGVPLKPVPRGITNQLGTDGRAPIMRDGDPIVQPTKLNYDPRKLTGVLPVRLNGDPRKQIGSSTEPAPAHVVMKELQIKGAGEWMLYWVQQRATKGILTDQKMLDRLAILNHYGDPIAGRLFAYAQSLNAQLQARAASVSGQLRRGMGLFVPRR